jgi:hypothetical protein
MSVCVPVIASGEVISFNATVMIVLFLVLGAKRIGDSFGGLLFV